MTAASGSLAIVGTGIRPGLQTTPECRALIRASDRVLYLLADPLGERWLLELRPDSESLSTCYSDGRPRLDSYTLMSERILSPVRSGDSVCVVFYGHPGVFVRPAHDAVRRARAEGYEAIMLPGISAEDMMFAEVGFDPAERGCQNHAATDFLLEHRRFDPCSALVLWQVGLVGEDTHRSAGYRSVGVRFLVEELLASYPAGHGVVLYEANELPIGPSSIHRCPLSELETAPLSVRSTLLVPPLAVRPRDVGLAARLEASLRAS